MQALVSYPQKGIPLRLAPAKAQVKARQGIASYRIVVPRGIVSSRLASSHSDRPANVSKDPPHRIRGGAKLTYLPQLQAPAAQPQSAQVQPAVPQPGILVVFVGVVGLCWVE
jgi:hypothetical protein